MENERADAGRDDRSCILVSRKTGLENFEARTRAGKVHFRCLADHKQDWKRYTVDVHCARPHEYT